MEHVDDVAAAVLAATKHRFPDDEFTAKKLEKLAYYCQAWSLAMCDESLFEETVEAWAEGPMVRHLYEQHRGRRVVTSWPTGSQERLSDDSWNLVTWVVRRYGQFSGEELGEMTHREAPWRLARKGLPDGERSSRPISLIEMRRFYGSLRLEGQAAADFAIGVSAIEGVELDAPAVILVGAVAEGWLDADEAVRRCIA